MGKIYLKKVKVEYYGCIGCYFWEKDSVKNCTGWENKPPCSAPSIIFIQVPPPEGGGK